VIGAISGGGKGAGVGAAAGAATGVAIAMLAKGPEAEITAGLPFGIELTRPLIVRESYFSRPPHNKAARAEPRTGAPTRGKNVEAARVKADRDVVSWQAAPVANPSDGYFFKSADQLTTRASVDAFPAPRGMATNRLPSGEMS